MSLPSMADMVKKAVCKAVMERLSVYEGDLNLTALSLEISLQKLKELIKEHAIEVTPRPRGRYRKIRSMKK